MIAAYLVLFIPFVGIIFFAIVGHKTDMGKINVWLNGICLLASIWLAINVLNQGTIFAIFGHFDPDFSSWILCGDLSV